MKREYAGIAFRQRQRQAAAARQFGIAVRAPFDEFAAQVFEARLAFAPGAGESLRAPGRGQGRQGRRRFRSEVVARHRLPVGNVHHQRDVDADRAVQGDRGQRQRAVVADGDPGGLLAGGRVEDLVWGYQSPLPDAAQLEGYVTFFDERSDLVVDGVPRPRPVTPWS